MHKLLNLQKWAEVLGEEIPFSPVRGMASLMNAVTVSAVTQLGQNLATCTIEATADADVASGNIAHGKGFTPDFAIITAILPQGVLKQWSWTPASTDGTNIVFTGANVVGSGVAGAQVRCWFGRVWSGAR